MTFNIDLQIFLKTRLTKVSFSDKKKLKLEMCNYYYHNLIFKNTIKIYIVLFYCKKVSHRLCTQYF